VPATTLVPNPMKYDLRPFFLCTAMAIFAFVSPTPARAENFPALNTPAVAGHLPGKLIWADLFTTNPEAASAFYCGLLGWTAMPLEHKGKGYTIFSNDGTPVAGLSPRSVAGANHPSRWIGYIAVTDISATLSAVERAGGVVRAPSRKFADRGRQAIIADRDGLPVGLLESSSGDPMDGDPKAGAWNWFELYVRSPQDTAAFYRDALGYAVAPETKPDTKSDFVLSSSMQGRGGIAPMPDGDSVKPAWLGVIRVQNLDATLAKVAGLGGEVLVAPHTVEFGSRFAIILDPTGGTIGLVEYIDGANPANTP